MPFLASVPDLTHENLCYVDPGMTIVAVSGGISPSSIARQAAAVASTPVFSSNRSHPSIQAQYSSQA